ncbi:MAG: hypothetical protein IJ297_05815, partial [Clostridia bacterium]|nr:hypothetical protein [Clostridia bacterium]
MSFLEEVKSELVELRIKKNCCMASEVRGLLTFGGVPFGDGVLFGTDSFAVAKRLSVFLRRLCNIDFTDRLSEDAESYKFVIPGDVLDNLKLSRGESIN